jgi:hypothetical protein
MTAIGIPCEHEVKLYEAASGGKEFPFRLINARWLGGDAQDQPDPVALFENVALYLTVDQHSDVAISAAASDAEDDDGPVAMTPLAGDNSRQFYNEIGYFK